MVLTMLAASARTPSSRSSFGESVGATGSSADGEIMRQCMVSRSGTVAYPRSVPTHAHVAVEHLSASHRDCSLLAAHAVHDAFETFRVRSVWDSTTGLLRT